MKTPTKRLTGWENYFDSTLSVDELHRLRTQHNDLYLRYFAGGMSKADLNTLLVARGAQPVSTEKWPKGR